MNQRISGGEIDYSTQQDYLDVLSRGEFDSTADGHEGKCSLFSQHLAHPWAFMSEQSLFQQKIEASLKNRSQKDKRYIRAVRFSSNKSLYLLVEL